MIDINELRRLAADCYWPTSPVSINELLDRLEAAEKDSAHHKALAESALRVAKGWEDKCGELRAALRHEADCVNAAKAKIEVMKGHPPYVSIDKILTEVMDIAAANGADSRSMPDEYVEVAAWLCGIPGAKGEEK